MDDFDRKELNDKLLKDFDDFEKEVSKTEKSKSSGYSLKLIVPLITLAIVAFITFSWYSDKFAISKTQSEIPLVRAYDLNVREKPEDPGGMHIPNRDKKIYETISSSNTQVDDLPEVTHILPEATAPIDRSQLNEIKEEDIAKLIEEKAKEKILQEKQKYEKLLEEQEKLREALKKEQEVLTRLRQEQEKIKNDTNIIAEKKPEENINNITEEHIKIIPKAKLSEQDLKLSLIHI